MKKTPYNISYNSIFPTYKEKKLKTASIKSRQFPYKIEVITENLNVPWAIDISNKGNIYFTERTESIRVIKDSKLNPHPLITFSIHL